jgi:hypothetical protein
VKKIVIATLCLMCSCTFRNSQGECVGLVSQDHKNPGVEYRISWWNIALGVIFSETILIPVVVAIDDFECPVEG